MLEIGKTDKLMVWVNLTTLMEMYLKVDFTMIKRMDSESTNTRMASDMKGSG